MISILLTLIIIPTFYSLVEKENSVTADDTQHNI